MCHYNFDDLTSLKVIGIQVGMKFVKLLSEKAYRINDQLETVGFYWGI